MIEITRITKTKRGRNALFSGDAFLFSVSDEVLGDSGLCEGDMLEEADLTALRRRSDTHAAKQAALAALGRRAYGEQELYQKLLLKFDEHSAAAAVAALCDAGLLDDAAYAAEKAAALSRQGRGGNEIQNRLRRLGIDAAVAQAAVAALEVDEGAAALEVVRRRYADKLCAGKRRQVMAALARRGFSHGDIRRAVEAAEAELGARDGAVEAL